MRGSRQLTQLGYLEELQKEYFMAKLRYQIHSYDKDRKYYTRVMELKKEKILDIAERNKLPHIFNDEELHDSVRSEIYPRSGLPFFIIEPNEIIRYYSRGTEVRVDLESRTTTGVIVFTNTEKHIVEVKLKGDSEATVHPMSRVTRVF